MLGIFDSGLGGLSVVRRLRERLPHHDLFFFADQAHVPYGGREPAELAGLLRRNIAILNEAGVSKIVMGCNTSCAIAQQFGWPQSAAPILDLIEAASIAVQRSGAKRIGVVATQATVASSAYTKAISLRVHGARVTEVAAPALVPLVEAGAAGTQAAHVAVAAVCAELPKDIEALVLACTHYPMLDGHFADALGESVQRIDPAIVQADRAAQSPNGAVAAAPGATYYRTNGDVEMFRASIRMIAGDFDPDVRGLEFRDVK
ncbi:MAG: glutamate racemase [Vulcanimicrobiaceae bacterium]